jgi:hypothetical protein
MVYREMRKNSKGWCRCGLFCGGCVVRKNFIIPWSEQTFAESWYHRHFQQLPMNCKSIRQEAVVVEFEALTRLFNAKLIKIRNTSDWSVWGSVMLGSQTWPFSTKRHTSSNLIIQHRKILNFDVLCLIYTESSSYLRDSHVLWLLQLPYSSTALSISIRCTCHTANVTCTRSWTASRKWSLPKFRGPRVWRNNWKNCRSVTHVTVGILSANYMSQ